MSLITRCPACRTMFKVVPDQLRISEGWVRCGKCEEIFDASAHMQDAALPQESRAVADAGSSAFEGALAQAMAEAGPERTAVGADAPPRAVAVSVNLELSEPQGDPVPVHGTIAAGPELLVDGPVHEVTDRAEPVFAADPVPVPPSAPAPVSELSFMRHPAQASRWHRPLVRAVLLVSCLLLVLGLALQALVQERDRLAAVEPGLRPLIEELCLQLGCRVEPLRQIESVVIDSSAFSKVKGDLYRLSLTLKNNAPIDLAMPAIELALTDTLDQALMRRVFQPEDLGVRSGVIPAASETQTTLVLTVKTNGSGERVAGYRLLAFYP